MGRDWYGWASDIFRVLGSHPFSVDVQVHECNVAFSHCKLYLIVASVEVVEKFCQFFLVMGPDDERII